MTSAFSGAFTVGLRKWPVFTIYRKGGLKPFTENRFRFCFVTDASERTIGEPTPLTTGFEAARREGGE